MRQLMWQPHVSLAQEIMIQNSLARDSSICSLVAVQAEYLKADRRVHLVVRIHASEHAFQGFGAV